MNISWSCWVSALIFCAGRLSAGMRLWTQSRRQRWEDSALAYPAPAPRRHRLAWLLVWPLSLCTSGSSSSYFRGRDRAEMTHSHLKPCSYALKVPKLHMTQETTPNVIMFLVKFNERETISPVLHPKHWTAASFKGADSVGLISSNRRIEYTRDCAQSLLGNDEASSCVSWSVKPSQYNRLMELMDGCSTGVH